MPFHYRPVAMTESPDPQTPRSAAISIRQANPCPLSGDNMALHEPARINTTHRFENDRHPRTNRTGKHEHEDIGSLLLAARLKVNHSRLTPARNVAIPCQGYAAPGTGSALQDLMKHLNSHTTASRWMDICQNSHQRFHQ